MAHDYCICGANRGSCIDCAANKIDYLTTQLAEAQSSCKLSFDQICTLKIQISERDAEIARIQTISDNYFVLATDRFLEITTLRTKLAECEKEVERLNQNIVGMLTERLSDVEKGRKQVAREIIDCIIQHGWGMHTIDHLRNCYGLER